MRKIYISGCGGMLGDAFKKVFINDFELKCSDIDLNVDWLTYCDIRDFDAYRNDVLSFKPDYLFHLGALTDLEFCENNKDNAYLTNTIATEYACTIANELDIPLLYISTAGIFDGSQEVYDDWDMPNPQGVYARSKYMGELHVKEKLTKYFICRAGWMMGGGNKKDKKFISKILKQIQNGAQELNVVDDKLGTPTYTIDFAKNVKLLIENNAYGLYNLVCDGVTSRFDVCEELLKLIGKDKEIKINKVNSSFFSKEYFAPRPDSERLVNYRLNLKKLNIMRDWKIALKDYIKEFYI